MGLLCSLVLKIPIIFNSPFYQEEDRNRHGKFGKDPTVETSFLPDRYKLLY